MTVKPVSAVPPVSTGATHDTVTAPLPSSTARSVGDCGTASGVTTDVVAGRLEPAALTTTTEKL